MATKNVTWLKARVSYLEGKSESLEKALDKTKARLRKRQQELAKAERVVAPTRISQRGLNLIAEFEGFIPHPYNDPAGHATIGFGHLIHRGNVTAADNQKWGTITRERGFQILRADVQQFERGVQKLVTVPLSQHQFDALVVFSFNVGLGALEQSTLLRVLNQKKYREAADQFLRWVLAGGQRMPGLVRRREAERKLFLTK